MSRAPLQPLSAGQPFPLSARTWNAVFAAADAFQRGQGRIHGPRLSSGVPRDVIQVVNDSGEELPRFGVVGLDGFPAIAGTRLDPADATVRTAAAAFLSDDLPICSAILPISGQHANSMAILLEAIGPRDIGRALITGVTPCQVELRSHQHQFADVRHEDPTQLVSVPLGPHRILGRLTPTFIGTDNGTGLRQWCLVQLGGGRRQEWFAWKHDGLGGTVLADGLVQLQPLYGAGVLVSQIWHRFAHAPDSYTPGGIALNHGTDVPAGGTGWATLDEGPLCVRYDPVAGIPSTGDTIGPHTLALGGYRSSEPQKYRLGFVCTAPPFLHQGTRLVDVARQDQQFVHGALSGSSALAMAVYRYNGTSNLDEATGQVLDVAPRLGGDTYPADTFGAATWTPNQNRWLLSHLNCG